MMASLPPRPLHPGPICQKRRRTPILDLQGMCGDQQWGGRPRLGRETYREGRRGEPTQITEHSHLQHGLAQVKVRKQVEPMQGDATKNNAT